jgi:3-isopropylmalate/(R)-2-methylmalate dehydratase small subunit
LRKPAFDWRRLPDGSLDPEFTLNQPRYNGASILVTDKNFGCGSSREHAVWALADFGFQAVIAPTFADIFANNCVQNGVLTVALTEQESAEIARRAREVANYELTIDLEQKKVFDSQGFSANFQIDDSIRHRLLNGLDDIGLTLQNEKEITAYEAEHPAIA